MIADKARLFLDNLPAFVPVVWRLVGRRGYDRYIRRVRGQDRAMTVDAAGQKAR
jgi:hypothetical protein